MTQSEKHERENCLENAGLEALMQRVCIRCNSYRVNLEKLESKSCSTELVVSKQFHECCSSVVHDNAEWDEL